MKIAIGCDIGGSHISCTGIDLRNGVIIKNSFYSAKVNNQGTADEIIDIWINALKECLSRIDISDLVGIGFAMPGPFEYHTGIARFVDTNAKYQNLYGINIGQVIKEKLGLNTAQDVRFVNDATAFAMGESWSGMAAQASRSLSITLGTGFGSAFINNGVPVVEGEEVPDLGCVWHLPFKNGIADDYFSTRWFVNRFVDKSGWLMMGVKEIANRVPFDSRAFDVFVEFGENLGLFLAPWIKKSKVEIIVIGGNISGAYSLFGPVFRDTLKKEGVEIPCVVSELKEDAALAGSARLFDDKVWTGIQPLLSKM